MKKLLIPLILLLAISISNPAIAIDIHEFETEQQRLDYQQLTIEIRCLVCQNQNIADSDATLAKDLRNEISKLVKQGQDQTQITDYLVARYGDFVRYSPPIRMDTIALWVMPFLVLLIAATLLIINIKRNQKDPKKQEAQS